MTITGRSLASARNEKLPGAAVPSGDILVIEASEWGSASKKEVEVNI